MAPKIISRKEAKAQGLKRYFTGKPCKNGHISEYHVSSKGCLACLRERSAAERRRDPEVHRARVRKHRVKYPERAREKSRRDHAKNRTERNAYSRAWNAAHRDHLREYNRAWSRINFRRYKLGNLLRTRLRVAVKGGQKNGSAIADLGCSIAFFREWIGTQFKDGMTWDNHGTVWQLDHINPLGLFDLTEHQQVLAACHYTNLQPLLIADHVSKTAQDLKLIRQRKRDNGKHFCVSPSAPLGRETQRKNRVKRGNSRKRQSRRKPSRAKGLTEPLETSW